MKTEFIGAEAIIEKYSEIFQKQIDKLKELQSLVAELKELGIELSVNYIDKKPLE